MAGSRARAVRTFFGAVYASILVTLLVAGCGIQQINPQMQADLAFNDERPSDRGKWHVVPVFYGTDRAREMGDERQRQGSGCVNRKLRLNRYKSVRICKNSERLRYNSDRAKRLEVGLAVVTVPSIHQVPNIERPSNYKLPFTDIIIIEEDEDPAKHFTIQELEALTPEEFAEKIRAQSKEQALVFVHGFNTTFDAAVYRTAQLSYDLKERYEFDGAAFLYSWPSRGKLSPIDYNYDQDSTEVAEPHLKTFLELIANKSGVKSVSIVAHSMGNRVLMRVLSQLKRTSPSSVRISQVILAAPDVDRDKFQELAKGIQGLRKGVTLYAASNDRALQASRKYSGGVPRAGDVSEQGPVVVAGVDTIDVTAASTEILSLNHSGYAQKSELLEDISKLIKKGERPPERRTPDLMRRVRSPTGDFWRYLPKKPQS